MKRQKVSSKKIRLIFYYPLSLQEKVCFHPVPPVTEALNCRTEK